MSVLPPNEARKRLVACQKALKQVVQNHPNPLTAREIFFHENSQPRRWREETIRKLLAQGILERGGDGHLPTYTATNIGKLRQIVEDNEAVARILWPSPVLDLMVTRGVTSETELPESEEQAPAKGGRKPGPPVVYKRSDGGDTYNCRFTWNNQRYFKSTGETDPVKAVATANRIYREITGQDPPPAEDENIFERTPSAETVLAPETAQEPPTLAPPPVLEGVNRPPPGAPSDVVQDWIFTLLHAQTENLIYMREELDSMRGKLDRVLSILEKLL